MESVDYARLAWPYSQVNLQAQPDMTLDGIHNGREGGRDPEGDINTLGKLVAD